MCEANHYELPALVRAKLLLGFHRLFLRRDEHFGNGRLVRNTFEGAVRRLANRVASVTPVTRELLTVFTPEDVAFAELPEDISACLQDQELRFRIDCTECRETYLLRADQLGRRVRCPRCQTSQQADWGEPPENAPLQAG